jgi:hypothetical protein
MNSITSGMFTGNTETQLTIKFSSKPKVDTFLIYSEHSPLKKILPFFEKTYPFFSPCDQISRLGPFHIFQQDRLTTIPNSHLSKNAFK